MFPKSTEFTFCEENCKVRCVETSERTTTGNSTSIVRLTTTL